MNVKSATLFAAVLACCAVASAEPRGNAVTDAPGESTKLNTTAPKMPEHPLAPPEYRRPEGYVSHPYERTLSQLRDEESEKTMAKAHELTAHVEKTLADTQHNRAHHQLQLVN